MQATVTKSDGQTRLEALMPVLKKHQEFKSEQWPVRSNYASKLGHPCERYLFYMRHDWDKIDPRNWKGVGILGNLLADWWKVYMQRKGFNVIHDQMPLSDELAKKYQIGGRIDGRIGWGNIKPVLYEFKSMSEHVYKKINSYEDLQDSKSDYIRAYPAQLQIYLLSNNEEAGLFVLCNKSTLEWKMIPVYLDMGYCEWLLQRADRVNKANEAGVPPARIPYGSTCAKCDFKTHCLPDIINEGIDLIDNSALEEILEERESTKEAHDRFEELDDEAKTIAKARGKDFVVGTEWKVEFKFSESERIDTKLIPPEIASQYRVKGKRTEIKFIPLKINV